MDYSSVAGSDGIKRKLTKDHLAVRNKPEGKYLVYGEKQRIRKEKRSERKRGREITNSSFKDCLIGTKQS